MAVGRVLDDTTPRADVLEAKARMLMARAACLVDRGFDTGRAKAEAVAEVDAALDDYLDATK